jgi:hypothetical protein
VTDEKPPICAYCSVVAHRLMGNPVIALRMLLFNEGIEVHMASLIVGTAPGDCDVCREVDDMKAANIPLCACCLDKLLEQPNLCPHGVKMRMSEPVEIK